MWDLNIEFYKYKFQLLLFYYFNKDDIHSNVFNSVTVCMGTGFIICVSTLWAQHSQSIDSLCDSVSTCETLSST